MTVQLLGAAEIRSLASRLEVNPTKKLGQNFVLDPNSIRRIVSAAKLQPGQRVAEIGPGLGSLTLGLLEAQASVVAVEIDPRLAGELEATIASHAPASAFNLILGGALRISAADLALAGPAPSALVANLPYNISVPVLLHFLATVDSLRSGLVLVQAEVAHRLAATKGSKIYGVPSVKLAWYAEASLAGNFGRNIFWPVPNVDSALVYFAKRGQPLGDEALRQRVFAVVDAAFGQRRKTLRQALATLAGGAERAQAALERAGIDPQARGEGLDVHDFVAIAREI